MSSRWQARSEGRADRWIKRTNVGCVGMLALIAGTVSYLHMHLLMELHGQPAWVAALTPLMLIDPLSKVLVSVRMLVRGR